MLFYILDNLGGTFLSRTDLTESTHGAVTPGSLYVGASIEMFSHRFHIHGADEFTLRYVRTARTVPTYVPIHTPLKDGMHLPLFSNYVLSN